MTSTEVCPSCGRMQQDGILCSDCCCAVETMIAAVPQLVEQLNVAISKQAKVGGGGKGGLARERAPINFGALAVRDALQVEAAYVGQDINWLRRHVQAAEIVRDFGMAVRAAYRAIDRAQERQYMGRCLNTVGEDECQAELWAKPNGREVECRLCGYVHDVATRRLDMLEMAQDVICSVKEASSYVGEVGGIRVSQSSIKGYLFRKRLLYVPGTTMIRLGDLLALLADESGKRSA